MRRHPSLISLSRDHHVGLTLALKCRKQALGQIRPMGAQGLRERAREVKDFFTGNLARHFQAEEEVLFPLIRSRIPNSHSLLEELLEDHTQIRAWALRIEKDADLARSLFDFGDLLERHIRREERELFPFFEGHVAPADAEKAKEEIEKILGDHNPI